MVRACSGRLCFRRCRFVQALPASPPLRGSGSVFPSASAFLFPCLFRVCPRRAKCVGVGVFSWFLSSFVAFPLSGSRLSSFHFTFIFISPPSSFILIFISLPGPQLTAPLLRGVCVKHLNRCKTSNFSSSRGHGSCFPSHANEAMGFSRRGMWTHIPVPAFFPKWRAAKPRTTMLTFEFFPPNELQSISEFCAAFLSILAR